MLDACPSPPSQPSHDSLNDLEPLWRALYEHHQALTPHLKDRERAFEQAWSIRRRIERESRR